ncbi:MAG: ferric iron uptake transcriptional regulator [Gammaproteobacteria bacterium]|nr:ferric iron uptake transcriptional regulator [Gammaproteobacteria bacterium]MBT5406113.1 ferric iron uptake transcriptional regulator [Gammaproteobacteria bacterium]MBT5644260.1 ferric iron uptake transcriptional regulator [Gammaproteobacteria bacterium]MBT6733786.1 ferric iron uptake transcriptional regulator [Gammaproteobacteria bacterium]MBT7236200.1 ferric iron uptake transcriptional regulator [Gammaproteobacteria bacterium]|tara:strand:- start:7104 stop:7523 length:420 start_codon:yes stop_codon:yes gene_type:complete
MSNNDTLKDAGLKVTHPRSEILDILQANPEMHLSADEIHNKLVDNKQSIGLATVYRVLTQLEIAGLIQKNQFSDNQSSYEIKKQHHDHLICTKCGKIIEFMNDDLEKLQEKISDKYQFRLDSHVMTLFGVCKNGSCQNE